MSSIVKIYNTTTGVLLESMSIPSLIENSGATRVTASDAVKNAKAQDDSAYTELVNQLAQRVAMRVTDIIFPGKIIAVTGGDGDAQPRRRHLDQPGRAVGSLRHRHELKDPDTGEVLGKEEVKLGELVISEVLPKFSKAQIYGENRGIAPGMIVRQKLPRRKSNSDRGPRAAPAASTGGTLSLST